MRPVGIRWSQSANKLAKVPNDLVEAKGGMAPERVLPQSLSPSSISTYRSCPKRFEYSKIDKLPDPPGKEALIGTFAHSVLEDLMKLAPEFREAESARRIARANWGRFESGRDFKRLGLDEASAKDFRWEAWRGIEGYFAMEDPATVDVVGTERKVGASIGDVMVRGIVDRLERAGDSTIVSDYKSGKVPSGRYRSEALQQPFLYAAILAESGVNVDRVRLLYIKASEEIAAEVEDTAIAQAKERVEETWASINQDFDEEFFEPKPGPLCNWCAYKPICPAHQ